MFFVFVDMIADGLIHEDKQKDFLIYSNLDLLFHQLSSDSRNVKISAIDDYFVESTDKKVQKITFLKVHYEFNYT